MASNDQRARHVLEAARAAGIPIPDQLAVIGVDNDETLCELSTPSISSVALDADTIGFQGAAMLARLMDGRRIPSAPSSCRRSASSRGRARTCSRWPTRRSSRR
jgi:LacI family transcriptional regulator